MFDCGFGDGEGDGEGDGVTDVVICDSWLITASMSSN